MTPENTTPRSDRLHTAINPSDMHRFGGKTVLVTGSTRGIGEGIARRFADEDANVVVTGRSSADGQAVADDIQNCGATATFIEADLADIEPIERLVTRTVNQFGSIDVLVNNAAAWTHGPFLDRTVDDWETVINVSLRAPWLLSKHAIDSMPAGGSIVNISSVHSMASDPQRFPYNVAKAGLNGMTRSMAADLGPLNITVNAILPGPVQIKDDPGDDPLLEHRLEGLPADRYGRPADIAGMTAFLASKEARFVTGASIPVDGGWTACLHDDPDVYGTRHSVD
ncbi:SDR family NAD(P)-dependent oxidoreductase [Halocatena halophila]|uniref:SDR family NAD(P)-dependent oxidoreductase n=1 Tax=Halocatena halophila TaxID=2814576 RepID=UPI002ED0680D